MVFIAPHILWGQDTSEQPENTKAFVNLPDTPAFKALGSEPSNLLLPSKPDELSAVFSEFYQGNQFIIPKDIAFEFAPALLFKKEPISLNEFNKDPVLNSARISIGTKRDSSGLSRLAFGLRISPIDKVDLRKNMGYLKKSTKLKTSVAQKAAKVLNDNLAALQEDPVIAKKALEKSAKKIKRKYPELTQKVESLRAEDAKYTFKDVSEILRDSSAFKVFEDVFDELIYNDAQDASKGEIKKLLKVVDEFKVSTEKRLWNAEMFDIAAAVVFASPDTLAGNIRFESITGWITYARPMDKSAGASTGQWLIGGQFGYKKNLDFANEDMSEGGLTASLATRVYLGSNDAKFFTEAQWAYKKITDQSQLLFQLGGEFRLALGLWFDFSMGLETDQLDGKSGFISNATMRYSLANGFKF